MLAGRVDPPQFHRTFGCRNGFIAVRPILSIVLSLPRQYKSALLDQRTSLPWLIEGPGILRSMAASGGRGLLIFKAIPHAPGRTR